jgi:hypothetical protein
MIPSPERSVFLVTLILRPTPGGAQQGVQVHHGGTEDTKKNIVWGRFAALFLFSVVSVPPWCIARAFLILARERSPAYSAFFNE